MLISEVFFSEESLPLSSFLSDRIFACRNDKGCARMCKASKFRATSSTSIDFHIQKRPPCLVSCTWHILTSRWQLYLAASISVLKLSSIVELRHFWIFCAKQPALQDKALGLVGSKQPWCKMIRNNVQLATNTLNQPQLCSSFVELWTRLTMTSAMKFRMRLNQLTRINNDLLVLGPWMVAVWSVLWSLCNMLRLQRSTEAVVQTSGVKTLLCVVLQPL